MNKTQIDCYSCRFRTFFEEVSEAWAEVERGALGREMGEVEKLL